MLTIEKIFFPKTIHESLTLLSEEKNSMIHAGGTDIIPRLKDNRILSPKLICLNKIEELRYIRKNEYGDTLIGSMATLSDIESDPLTSKYEALLSSINCIGSRQIRNRATLVGNIGNASPAADSIPALIILDAQVLVSSASTSYEIPLLNFILAPGKTVLKPNEMIMEIRIPAINEKFATDFQRLGRRKAVDIATVNASCYLSESGIIKLSVGAVSPVPIRLHELEKEIKAKGPGVLQNIKKITEINPISDIRAENDYREDMARILVKRCVENAIKKLERIK